MLQGRTGRPARRFPSCKLLRLAAVFVCFGLALITPALRAADPDIFPLSQIQPGMKGEVYTIFAGDQIEKVDLEVIGVMPNFLAPKESIILVMLLGPKVEHTGVVAGMSGSPVYFNGKLAGALSLKLGQFSKEPLAGVTPIENILSLPKTQPGTMRADATSGGASPTPQTSASLDARLQIPSDWASRAGISGGSFLTPIASPLVFSGFSAAAIRQFENEFAPYGMAATQGGSIDARPDDGNIKPGDMVSAVLLEGDLSLNASCTVTTIVDGRVYVCGHPLFGFGSVQMPMARARVLTTLSSELESTKIVNVGGTIGSFSQDRVTAVVGSLGSSPKLIPVDMTVATPDGDKHLSFRMMSNPKITPILMGICALNGLVQNSVYGEGTTLHLTGGIEIAGHSSVTLDNLFPPLDSFAPDGLPVASSVQIVFQRIFSNQYETPNIERVSLRMEALPERRQSTIEGAWLDRPEAEPGDTVTVRVQLRPYRGAPVIRDIPVVIPPQAVRGSYMQILASDSNTLNRMSIVSGSQARLESLEQLISVLNRERRNNRLYVTLLGPAPTMVVQDKVMPNVPASQINLLDQRGGPASSLVVRESAAGEWSLPLDQIVQGSASIAIHIK
jgi:SpoIVB peptidase S55